jgi:hypothetical protein
MLSAWLRKMLDWVYGDKLAAMLTAATRYCETRAASDYSDAARFLRPEEEDRDWAQKASLARSVDAAKWFDRKAILLKAKAEIEAIR